MTFTTADLYDKYGDDLKVALPIFKDYGAKRIFHGPISTVKAYEDNSLVRTALEEPGEGRILIVDGDESLRCAMLGDMLAKLGMENGWSGIIVFGCIRDADVIATIDIGVKALNTNPRKSLKRGLGDRDIPVSFASITFNVGEYVYADTDGVIVSEKKIGM
nr:ribonuclease E activity regulator RraA [Gammaproteobacteria bacterium]